MDRTQEFRQTLESLRPALATSPSSGQSLQPLLLNVSPASSDPSPISQSHLFKEFASSIGKGMFNVACKLERLTLLARQQKLLFSDPKHEINELTAAVKEDIQKLNSGIDALATYVEHSQNTSSQSHANAQSIVKNLRADLKSKAKDFFDILETRTQSLRVQSTSRMNFQGFSGEARRRTVPTNSQLLSESLDLVGDELSPDQIDPNLLDHSQYVLSQDVVEARPLAMDTYLEDRQEAVHQIEMIILELAEMYKRLNDLILQQEDVAIRIDRNVDETVQRVDGGYVQLVQYFQDLKNDRVSVFKIFSVLIVFVVFFLIVVA